jgi:NAD(P)-dependent dehydrogenase (short-subunit alcohol dehydrogenase family)
MTDGAWPPGGRAIVVGSAGGIGSALVDVLQESAQFSQVIGLSRNSDPAFDLTDPASIAAAAQRLALDEAPIRLIIVATGVLKSDDVSPEKSWRELDAAALAHSFAINAIGPAMVLRHFLPLLPREGRSVVAALSARVGSIGDNRLGGWYGYRASKAALNQLIRTASVELSRNRPDALCVALHPGTVATPLSDPFVKSGLDLQTPALAASRLFSVLSGLSLADNGGFFDHMGQAVPW